MIVIKHNVESLLLKFEIINRICWTYLFNRFFYNGLVSCLRDIRMMFSCSFKDEFLKIFNFIIFYICALRKRENSLPRVRITKRVGKLCEIDNLLQQVGNKIKKLRERSLFKRFCFRFSLEFSPNLTTTIPAM